MYLLITTTTPAGPEVGMVALRLPGCSECGDEGAAGSERDCPNANAEREAIRAVLAGRARQHTEMWPGVPMWPVAQVDLVEQLGAAPAVSWQVEVPPCP
jgi:hypothetical protein